MKAARIIGLAMMAGILAAGCGGGGEKKGDAAADDLFRKSVALTELFTKKMTTAKDSAAVDSLLTLYRDSIDAINFQYAPDTDLHLTEGQNDTLFRLQRLLLDAAGRHLAPPDTTSTDSIRTDTIARPANK